MGKLDIADQVVEYLNRVDAVAPELLKELVAVEVPVSDDALDVIWDRPTLPSSPHGGFRAVLNGIISVLGSSKCIRYVDARWIWDWRMHMTPPDELEEKEEAVMKSKESTMRELVMKKYEEKEAEKKSGCGTYWVHLWLPTHQLYHPNGRPACSTKGELEEKAPSVNGPFHRRADAEGFLCAAVASGHWGQGVISESRTDA